MAIFLELAPTSSKTQDTSAPVLPTEVPNLTQTGKWVKSLSITPLSTVNFILLSQPFNQAILFICHLLYYYIAIILLVLFLGFKPIFKELLGFYPYFTIIDLFFFVPPTLYQLSLSTFSFLPLYK